MNNFEFLQNIAIGQYLPGDSVLHRADPRFKLLLVSVSVISLLICYNLSGLSLGLASVIGGFFIARIPRGYAVKGLRPALPVLLFLAALQIIAIPQNDTGTVFARWWIITLTSTDILAALRMMARFITLILLVILFSCVTSTKELTHGTELLFRPLQRFGFPAHELSLIITIALRFLPILALEAEHIVKAQASRGADFGKGRMGIVKRVRRMLPILIPLFLQALRRSETLILAMEARCYTGGRGRTRLIQFKPHLVDALLSACSAALNGFLILTNSLNLDRHIWEWLTEMKL